ncbi:uncharacterized protein [Ambystoma mexicanum]|uniref:uncharacterized protein isoform X2 n=1 Tax=Ambystoma mexicanum TaxID=8296 RepID=UPI0037E8E221
MSQQRRGRRMVGKLRTMNGKSAPQVGEDEQGASKEESTASEDIVYIDHMGISYQGPPNSSKYACSNKLAKDTFQSQVKNRVTTSQPSTDGKASSNDSAKHVETSTMTSKANTSCAVCWIELEGLPVNAPPGVASEPGAWELLSREAVDELRQLKPSPERSCRHVRSGAGGDAFSWRPEPVCAQKRHWPPPLNYRRRERATRSRSNASSVT